MYGICKNLLWHFCVLIDDCSSRFPLLRHQLTGRIECRTSGDKIYAKSLVLLCCVISLCWCEVACRNLRSSQLESVCVQRCSTCWNRSVIFRLMFWFSASICRHRMDPSSTHSASESRCCWSWVQGSYRSGKTGKGRGMWLVRES